MEDIKVIDLYMDDREFRNYVNTMLRKHGYVRFYMDDSRVSDEEFDNNNDIKVSKDGMRYDVQTYLNTEIGEKEINDTLEDMGNEGLKYGLIVTNMIVNDEVKKEAINMHIRVLDRKDFDENIYE